MSEEVAARAGALLDRAVQAVRPVRGGDVCSAYRVDLDGGPVFAKTRAGAPPGFFAVEAAGLDRLRAAGGPPVPQVLAHDEELLVLAWVEEGRPTAAAAAELGRALAALHTTGPAAFGGEADGWIASLPLPNRPAPDWPAFYAEQRLRPFLDRAAGRGALAAADRAAVEQVIDALPALAGSPEPPALLHGDLWSGNVLWTVDGSAWLVDPAVHAGHRETDLAMLALFGTPHLDRLLAAYDEAAPLAPGWQVRVGLHQLHPLLVHAALFGGGYGARAGALARAQLARLTP